MQNNIILEIRPGVGGDEAELWAKELFDMYERLANKLGWRWHTISVKHSDLGGAKEAVVEISDQRPNSRTVDSRPWTLLQYEVGVHRVQRIPRTEKRGRIHTSTATVAVLPVVSEQEVKIYPNDLQTSFYRAGGHGGQNVNKVETAVRIRHIPTGLMVTSQDERSQAANRERAMAVLRAKLYELEKQKASGRQQAVRLNQIGSGDRSEKIRTYNFPQDRVTDHQIGQSWSGVERVLAGDILKITQALATYSGLGH